MFLGRPDFDIQSPFDNIGGCTEVKVKDSDSASRTPYKYNGGSKSKSDKVLISIDAFVLTLRSIPGMEVSPNGANYIEFETGKVQLHSLGDGSKHYKYRYGVFIEGIEGRFGVILTNPRSSILAREQSEFKLDNNILYQDGWTKNVLYFLEAAKMEVNNITRLDLAADGFNVLHNFKRCNKGVLYKKGRAKLQTGYEKQEIKEGQEIVKNGNKTINPGKVVKTPTSFTVGSKRSDIQVFGYEKGKRIEKENKMYIGDFWKRGGLIKEVNKDYFANAERCELRLKNKAIQRLRTPDPETGEALTGVDISQLEDTKYLAKIFRAMIKDYCEFIDVKDLFKKDGTKKKLSRCKTIDIFDYSRIEKVSDDFVKAKVCKKPSDIWKAKRAASFMVGSGKESTEKIILNEFLKIMRVQNPELLEDQLKISMNGLGEKIAMALANEYGFSDYIRRKISYKTPVVEIRQDLRRAM